MGGEKQKEMGVEQRNWKMREGLERGQNKKKRRVGPCVSLVKSVLWPRLIANKCLNVVEQAP